MTSMWFNRAEEHLFGRYITAEVSSLLEQAAYASSLDETLAEQKLWRAQQLYPEQIEIYIAIYKFYTARARLAESHQTLSQAMRAAADIGGFPRDWRVLTWNSSDWGLSTRPQRLYLYCLKELSTLLLRMKAADESYRALMKCYEIDPANQLVSVPAHRQVGDK